jgi:hypothetical protein
VDGHRVAGLVHEQRRRCVHPTIVSGDECGLVGRPVVTQSPPLAQVSIDQVAEPPDLGVAGIAVEDNRLFELGTASGQAAMGDEMTAIDMDLGIGMGGRLVPPFPLMAR